VRSPGPLAVATLLALGCSAPERANVLLIVADTLRADALACYGGAARTPNLCRVAAQGALFEQARSAAPWTAPSAVALFTGSHPDGFADRPAGERDPVYLVGAEHETLAEALAARGWAAAADVDNFLVHQTGALQGLARLDPNTAGAGGAAAAIPSQEERARRMYAAYDFLAAAREPFLAVRWTMDPHAPYAPPPELLAELEPAAAGLPRPLAFYASLGHQNAEHRLRRYAPGFGDAERRLLRALYDKEVEWLDRCVGWLFEALDRRGLWARTFVVVTSDHGEGFGEHGVFLHGKGLHDELLRVPLLIAGPGIPAGLRVAAPVSLTDLVPTLRELLGVDCCAEAQGRSFAPLLRGASAAERLVYAGSPNDGGRTTGALVAGGLKWIGSAEGGALFDLAADPGETRDLARERPADAARLAGRLGALRAENEALRARRLAARKGGELETVRARTRRELEALGYVE
jgi:arylsulfatase A-like enzyme